MSSIHQKAYVRPSAFNDDDSKEPTESPEKVEGDVDKKNGQEKVQANFWKLKKGRCQEPSEYCQKPR